MIPSSLIDNIVVNKTATPDMPAEFAGGLVQINIRDMPAENYTTVTLGSGFNTNTPVIHSFPPKEVNTITRLR